MHAFAYYVPQNPDYFGVYLGFLEAATNLYGYLSPEYKAVLNAFAAVGFGFKASDSTDPEFEYANIFHVDPIGLTARVYSVVT